MKKESEARAPRGRPRSFDIEKAVDKALEVFWRKGYEGASLSDLTKAMGINRPSLYAAFGDKQTLFRRTLDRYTQGPAAYVLEALNAPNARTVAERLLQAAADSLLNPRHPRGCLLVQGAHACGESANVVQRELIARRLAGEAAVRKRLQRARSEGDLPPDADPATLARYLSTVMHGMAVEAAAGATRRQLQQVIQTALRAWPE